LQQQLRRRRAARDKDALAVPPLLTKNQNHGLLKIELDPTAKNKDPSADEASVPSEL
jgi:hypothetical protein